MTNVSEPPDVILQTPEVDVVNVGDRPEVALALNVGEVPNSWAPGFPNVIVCAPCGVIELVEPDAKLVPVEFVATTLNV